MSNWQNRIVGEGFEDPEQLLANPMNFRIHPKNQQDALAGVLNEVGWVQRVIVNKSTQHVIDGHLRVSMAISQGETQVPVIYVDLTEAEELLILSTIDPLSAMAVTDAAKLDDLLREVNSGEAGVQAMLSKLAISSGLVPTDNPYDEWTGMPEFEQDELKGFHRVTVVFETEADLIDFAERLGQTVTEKTATVFHPMRRSRGASSNRVVDEP